MFYNLQQCTQNVLTTDQETNFTPESKRLIEAKINKQKMEFAV